MPKVPTAEEFLAKIDTDIYADGPVSSESGYSYKSVHKMLKVFAKIHVKAALEEASKRVTANSVTPVMGGKPIFKKVRVNTDSILNAYPLTNIK